MKRSRLSKEIEYCKSTVYPLLQATRGLQRVRYRHGNTEFGKDFTFSYFNPLSVWVNCGVQVKYGDISGRSNRLITDLANQIPIAFSVPYKDTPLESDEYINELYIICSGKYTSNAITIIESQLGLNKYNVQFWDRQHVLELRERVLMVGKEEVRDLQQALNSLLIEIDHNIDIAKEIVQTTDNFIEKKKHILLNYRLNCLEKILGTNIDDKWIIDEAIIEWNSLTVANNQLSEIRMYGEAEQKMKLKENAKTHIRNLTNFRKYIDQYLQKIQ